MSAKLPLILCRSHTGNMFTTPFLHRKQSCVPLSMFLFQAFFLFYYLTIKPLKPFVTVIFLDRCTSCSLLCNSKQWDLHLWTAWTLCLTPASARGGGDVSLPLLDACGHNPTWQVETFWTVCLMHPPRRVASRLSLPNACRHPCNGWRTAAMPPPERRSPVYINIYPHNCHYSR